MNTTHQGLHWVHTEEELRLQASSSKGEWVLGRVRFYEVAKHRKFVTWTSAPFDDNIDDVPHETLKDAQDHLIAWTIANLLEGK